EAGASWVRAGKAAANSIQSTSNVARRITTSARACKTFAAPRRFVNHRPARRGQVLVDILQIDDKMRKRCARANVLQPESDGSIEFGGVIRRAGPAVPSSGALPGAFLNKSIYDWRSPLSRGGVS